MTSDIGMDNHLPISKAGLLAAIETAISIARSGEQQFTIEYLERLRQNIIDAAEYKEAKYGN